MPLRHFSRRAGSLLFAASFSALMAGGAAAQSYPDTPNVYFGIGASFLHIDDIEFAAITDFLVTEVVDHQSNHDGGMDGYKIEGGIAGLMPHRRGNWLASFGAHGFYSRYEDEQQTRCVFSGTDTDCVFFPLVDPDPDGTSGLPGGADASGGFFSDWLTDVERKVVHWGAAVEMTLSRYHVRPAPSLKDGGGSLKDAPAPAPVPSPFEWRAGLALRQLDQDAFLFSVDRGPTADPVTLDDDIDTTYYGGYFGFSAYKPLDAATRLKLSADAGLYYAKTDYRSFNTASASLGDDSPVEASVDLSDSAASFIGLLSLALERDLGPVSLALFGEAEWISYVPKVLYNDTDLNSGVPFDIVGSQNGTELGEGSALTYTVGARLSVPFR